MSDTIHRYLIKYPHARPSTIQYLVKREEIVEQLKAEAEAERKKRRRSWMFWFGWRNAQR